MMRNCLNDEKQLKHLSVEYHYLKGNQIKNKPTMANACE
jgi:hypothetical protein